MKNFLLLFIVTFTSCLAVGDVKVDGYYRKDGTYVQPHYRSDPNGTKSDNWTTKGNINPYTGEIGTRTYDNYNNYGRGDGSGNDGYGDYRDDRSNGYELPGHYGSNGEFYHDNGNIYKPYIALEENDSEWIGRWRQDSSDSQTYRSISEQSAKEKEEGWTIGLVAFAVFIAVGIWGEYLA